MMPRMLYESTRGTRHRFRHRVSDRRARPPRIVDDATRRAVIRGFNIVTADEYGYGDIAAEFDKRDGWPRKEEDSLAGGEPPGRLPSLQHHPEAGLDRPLRDSVLFRLRGRRSDECPGVWPRRCRWAPGSGRKPGSRQAAMSQYRLSSPGRGLKSVAAGPGGAGQLKMFTRPRPRPGTSCSSCTPPRAPAPARREGARHDDAVGRRGARDPLLRGPAVAHRRRRDRDEPKMVPDHSAEIATPLTDPPE